MGRNASVEGLLCLTEALSKRRFEFNTGNFVSSAMNSPVIALMLTHQRSWLSRSNVDAFDVPAEAFRQPNCLTSATDCILYADDTTIFTSQEKLSSVISQLNDDLSNISYWGHNIQLLINPSKTKFVVFSAPTKPRDDLNPLNININAINRLMNAHSWKLNLTVF